MRISGAREVHKLRTLHYTMKALNLTIITIVTCKQPNKRGYKWLHIAQNLLVYKKVTLYNANNAQYLFFKITLSKVQEKMLIST